MEEGVFQNSSEMKRIADEMEGDSKKLAEVVSEMYDVLSKNLGTEDDGTKAWFGPKAQQFLDNIKAKETDFDNQRENIHKVSQNLKDQAQAWENFEK